MQELSIPANIGNCDRRDLSPKLFLVQRKSSIDRVVERGLDACGPVRLLNRRGMSFGSDARRARTL